MIFYFCCCCVASVVSDSVRPQRRQPTRLPRPWDSPGKNTWVGCHFLLQCMKGKVKVRSLSRVRLLATAWTAADQAPPSMGFSRQEYWSGVPLPSPWKPAVSGLPSLPGDSDGPNIWEPLLQSIMINYPPNPLRKFDLGPLSSLLPASGKGKNGWRNLTQFL